MRATKAAEDRHIGFRWLRWAARLEEEDAAEAVFRAVVAELARRLGPGASRHVRAHLPLGLRETWDEEAVGLRQEAIHREEFVARVRDRLGLRVDREAEALVSLVFAWLRHLAPEERDDLAATLPADLRGLWERAHVEAPPWEQLHLPRRGTNGLPLRVRFRTAGDVFEEPAYDVPAVGSLWWHGSTPYRVERVDAADRPTVVLAADPPLAERCSLPAGYRLTARQRPVDGVWVAEVCDVQGATVSWWEARDCLAAVEEAHAIALRSLARESGYHPERDASP